MVCRGAASGALQLLASAVIVLATAGTLFAQGSAREMYTQALADERELRALTREPLTLHRLAQGDRRVRGDRAPLPEKRVQ